MRDEDPYIPCEPDNLVMEKLGTSSLQSTQNIKNTRASSRFFIFFVSFGELRSPSFSSSEILMAGDEGFEPPNAGTRTRCLTTWRIPSANIFYHIFI